jgi:hypothetical protein
MLKALCDFPYAGRSLREEELFEPLSASDAHVLILAGRAVVVEVQAAPDTDEAIIEPSVASKRRYKRRDMQAEER